MSGTQDKIDKVDDDLDKKLGAQDKDIKKASEDGEKLADEV